MKKYNLKIVIISIGLLFSLESIAQKYTFSPAKTMTITQPVDSFFIFDINIKNISGANLDLSWTPLLNTLDTSWVDFSLCDYGSCYPGIPSGVHNMNTAAPNVNAFFGLNLSPKKGNKSGIVKLLLYEKGTDPLKGDTVTYFVNTSVTGIYENASLQNMMNLYPNPANDFIHISLSDKIKGGNPVEVYNAIGETVLTFSALNPIANVSSLPAGLYFLRYITPVGQVISKTINKL